MQASVAWARVEGELAAAVGSGPHPAQPTSPLRASATEGAAVLMCLVLKMSRPRLPTRHVRRGQGRNSKRRIRQTRSPVSLQQEMQQTVAWPVLVLVLVLGGNDTQ